MKTTNPSLIKSCFEGALKPGDHSKDFIIEPDYCLVFIGKITYRAHSVRVLVSWRDMEGKFFMPKFYGKNPILCLLKDKIPEDITIVQGPCNLLTRSYLTVLKIVSPSYNNQGEIDKLISILNKEYKNLPTCERERFWEKLDSNDNPCRKMWNGSHDYDLTGVSSLIAAGLMERRLSS